MVQCIATFIDACYIARRNTISALMLQRFNECVRHFHELRAVFTDTGVRTNISLPRQHALSHYYAMIQLFGSPNGICSSITESKHIKAVKEPWRRSSRFKALVQMLRSILRMEKMAALRRVLLKKGLLQGTVSEHVTNHLKSGQQLGGSYVDSDENSMDVDDTSLNGEIKDYIGDQSSNIVSHNEPEDSGIIDEHHLKDSDDENHLRIGTRENDDVYPVDGDASEAFEEPGTTDIVLSKRPRQYLICSYYVIIFY